MDAKGSASLRGRNAALRAGSVFFESFVPIARSLY